MAKVPVLVLTVLVFTIFAIGSLHVTQAAPSPPMVVHASFGRAMNPAPVASNPAPAYDEQVGITFTQDFVSLSYNVTAVAQSDSGGFGPAYLLNGLTDGGYWYQVGVSWNWPYLNGGHASDFEMNYEVFDNTGKSIFPSMGGGLTVFSGSVHSGDSILLSLYFSGGNVVMSARDWQGGATASETYSLSGTKFIGLSSTGDSHGFFTGLMTEWYHTSAYYGGEGAVKYSNPKFALSSAYLWADEYVAPCCPTPLFFTYDSVSFLNPSQIQTFSSNGALAAASAYIFITGSLGSQLLTLSYSVQGGGSAYSPPSLAYIYNGLRHTANLTDTPTTYFADNATSWSITNPLRESTNLQRWETNQKTNGTVSSSITANLAYFQQVFVTFEYTVDTNGAKAMPPLPNLPSIQYRQFGGLFTTRSSSSVWADVGSAYSYANEFIGSTSFERWGTPATSQTVSNPGTVNAVYYHQYALSASYSVLGGLAFIPPTLTGTQFASPLSAGLVQLGGVIWLDSGTKWSVTNPLQGSTSNERWVSNSTLSGSMSGAETTSPIYYHQYTLTANYTITGGGSPTSPSISGIQFGEVFSAMLSGSPTAYFFDSFTTWTIPGALAGGSANERWVSAQLNGSEVIGESTVEMNYHHQFYVSASFGPSAGGSIANSTGWYDSGSNVQLNASARTGWRFVGWAGSGSGAYTGPLNKTTVHTNGPIVENATFYPGLSIAAGANGGVSYSYGSHSGTVPTGESVIVYAPMGSVISLNANPSSLLYQFAAWKPTSTGSSGQTTIRLDAPTTAQASFSLNFVTIGIVLGGVAAVGVVSVMFVRRRSKPHLGNEVSRA